MDILHEDLEYLRCNHCQCYLSCGPVYLLQNEENLCGRCSNSKESGTRNKSYETLAKLVKFPCKYQEYGCQTKLEFLEGSQPHERICQYRPLMCPFVTSSSCEWVGEQRNLLVHCRSEHPEKIAENPCTHSNDTTEANKKTYLLATFHSLFLLHIKICTKKIYYTVRSLGLDLEAASKFIFKVDIKKEHSDFSESGHVVPEGSIEDEKNTIQLDINGLAAVFHTLNDVTFNLEVQELKVKCAQNCGAVVEKFQFRDKNGWWCERCSPDCKKCVNSAKGCKYVDMNKKCEKHGFFFCKYSNYCYICDEDISDTTLLKHYDFIHDDITHKSGTKWGITVEKKWRYCIVTSIAGDSVCKYWLNEKEFEIYVRIPVTSEQLHQYNCLLQLSDPHSKRNYTKLLDNLYDDYNDWNIQVKDKDLPLNHDKLDIRIDITKK